MHRFRSVFAIAKCVDSWGANDPLIRLIDGDTNLDHKVDFGDFLRLSNWFSVNVIDECSSEGQRQSGNNKSENTQIEYRFDALERFRDLVLGRRISGERLAMEWYMLDLVWTMEDERAWQRTEKQLLLELDLREASLSKELQQLVEIDSTFATLDSFDLEVIDV